MVLTHVRSTDPSEAGRAMGSERRVRFAGVDVGIVWSAVILLLVGSTVASSDFLTARNLFDLLGNGAVLAVLVLAELPLVLAGYIDISVQSVVSFAPMVAGELVIKPIAGSSPGFGTHLSPLLGYLACLAIGAGIGAINGTLIVKFGLNAFILTLAVMILLEGAALGISSGLTAYSPPAPLGYPGYSYIGRLPVASLFAAGLFVLLGLVLRFHRTGTYLYAIGGNANAASRSGVNVARVVFGTYVFTGILSAFGGMMLSGIIDSILPNQGQNEIFSVFAALAIGGVSLFGGKGTVLGALGGVVFLTVISNILVLVGVTSFWVEATQGGLIVLALVVQRITAAAQRTEAAPAL